MNKFRFDAKTLHTYAARTKLNVKLADKNAFNTQPQPHIMIASPHPRYLLFHSTKIDEIVEIILAWLSIRESYQYYTTTTHYHSFVIYYLTIKINLLK